MRMRVMLAVLTVVAVLSGCSGTKMTSRWRDDAYTGRPAKIFIICWLDERGPRTLVEDEFVRQLRSRGADALASYAYFPNGPRPSREAMLAKVRETGADSILVLRFLRKEAGDTYTPGRRYPTPEGFKTDWDRFMNIASDIAVRDVSYDYDVITMENVLYQASTGAPIWSGISETTYQGSALRQIRPFTTAVIKDLVREKMVP